jgi:CDP-diglyceride synthetase
LRCRFCLVHASGRKGPMRLSNIVYFLLLLTIANGVPVIAKRLCGSFLSFPLDGGKILADGNPLFGETKTLRGVAVSVISTSIAAPMFGWSWITGCLAGGAAMTGDLFSSFIKRRMGKRSSSRAPGIDQIPECYLSRSDCRVCSGAGIPAAGRRASRSCT